MPNFIPLEDRAAEREALAAERAAAAADLDAALEAAGAAWARLDAAGKELARTYYLTRRQRAAGPTIDNTRDHVGKAAAARGLPVNIGVPPHADTFPTVAAEVARQDAWINQ